MPSEVNNQKTRSFMKHLLGLSYNKKCADCEKSHPTWAAVTFSFFVCYECSALHRSLGPLVSKVKNTSMDAWSVEELRRMHVGGNKNAYRIPPNEDIKVKYGNVSEFVAELDRLCAESERKEPGDSFIEGDVAPRFDEFGKVSIKKKTMPKLGKVLESITECEEESVSETIEKTRPKPKCEEVRERGEESLQRSKKKISETRGSVDERSPFSFRNSKGSN